MKVDAMFSVAQPQETVFCVLSPQKRKEVNLSATRCSAVPAFCSTTALSALI